ncbi:hypothetical protein SDC9_82643 [bioreactor metagenome]|uniref:FlgN protein n=1 Tax=bioreactor metagenome TaxID=1076179 RepID=A0A644Z6Y2_9ZZZZ
MSSLSDFCKLVVELTDLLKILKVVEENKLSAITEKNLIKLDACIKDEQVQTMKLRGLEKKREQLQTSLGFGDFTFGQIIETMQGDEKKEAKKLFSSLQKATQDFKSINKSVKTALEVKLYSINTMLEKSQNDSDKPKKNLSKNKFTSTNRFV